MGFFAAATTSWHWPMGLSSSTGRQVNEGAWVKQWSYRLKAGCFRPDHDLLFISVQSFNIRTHDFSN
jgi:hypothetical protein